MVSIAEVVEEIRAQLVRAPSGCLIYTGTLTDKGYGSNRRGRSLGVSSVTHRVIWEYTNGSVPLGLILDHQCHNDDPLCLGGVTCSHRACADLSHLRLTTRAANSALQRSAEARRTRCPAGHLYDEENTYHWRGSRMCKKCRRAAFLRFKAKAS